jgi:isochorismate hydrolase
MASRRELVRVMVMNAICDGYENLHQISNQLTVTCSRCGMNIGTPEILQT